MNYLFNVIFTNNQNSSYGYQAQRLSLNEARENSATKTKLANELTKALNKIIHSPNLDQGADILGEFMEKPYKLSNLLNRNFKNQYPKINSLLASLHLDTNYSKLIKAFKPNFKNFLLNSKNLLGNKHNEALHEFSLFLTNSITQESLNDFGDRTRIQEALRSCNKVFENCSNNLEMIKLAQEICIKKPHFLSESLDIWKNLCEKLDVNVGLKICLASELLKIFSKFIPREQPKL